MKLPAKVYAVRNEVTGKIYVGLSANLKQRIQHHLADLRAGRHSVEDMQADFNRYGEHFSVVVLDEVKTYAERSKEFKWQIKLRTLDRRYGYNYKDPVTKWYNRSQPEAQ